MAKQSKHLKGYGQRVDRGQGFGPDNDHSKQQNLGLSELDEDYNRQLRQLMVLVKEAGCKFGDFAQLDNNKETG